MLPLRRFPGRRFPVAAASSPVPRLVPLKRQDRLYPGGRFEPRHPPPQPRMLAAGSGVSVPSPHGVDPASACRYQPKYNKAHPESLLFTFAQPATGADFFQIAKRGARCSRLLKRRATKRWEKSAPSLGVAAKIRSYFVVVLALESPKSSSSASSERIFARNAGHGKVNNRLWAGASAPGAVA